MRHNVQAFACNASILLCILLGPRAARCQVYVGLDETFRIGESTSESFTLDGGSLFAGAVEISGPIDLLSESAFVRTSSPDRQGATTVSGLVSGSGDLLVTNFSDGPINLSGSNKYLGRTYIKEGEVRVLTSDGLGASAGNTVVQGGALRIEASTDEPLLVEGGELFFGSGDVLSSVPVTVAGGTVWIPEEVEGQAMPLVVDGSGLIRFDSWSGVSSGTGDLTLVGNAVDGELGHHGDLIVASAELNSRNTFTGKTIVGGKLAINHPGALGQSGEALQLKQGSITFNAIPEGPVDLRVERGELIFTAAEPLAGSITLDGTRAAYISGTGTIDAEMNYVQPPFEQSRIVGVTLNGPIRGKGDFSIGSGAVLNAANQFDGIVSTSGSSMEPVVVNHPEALDLTATQNSGYLEFNVPVRHLPLAASFADGTTTLNVDQQIGAALVLGSGTLHTNADIQVERFLLTGMRDGIFDQGGSRLTTSGTGQLNVSDELLILHSATIGGSIQGAGRIHAAGANFVVGDINEFNGEVIADNGITYFAEDSRLGRSKIVLQDDATVLVGRDQQLRNDISFQANGADPVFRPRFEMRGSVRLTGNIDVGNGEAIWIGGINANRVSGVVLGVDLSVQNGGLTFESPQEELSGTLRIQNGDVSLSSNATLTSLDTIHLAQGGVFALQASDAIDRLPESTTIRSFGGGLSIRSDQTHASSETIGALVLEKGKTTISNSSQHSTLATRFTVEDFSRQRGAVLNYVQEGRRTSTKIEGLQMFDETMVGGWATFGGEFLAVNDFGALTELEATSTDIASAGAADHVRLEVQQPTLSEDKVIASLRTAGVLDLGGASVNGRVRRRAFRWEHFERQTHGRAGRTCGTVLAPTNGYSIGRRG